MKPNLFNAQDQVKITSLGLEFALTEIVGAAIGWYLDTKLGTLPWCLLGGVFLGFALGLYRVIQVAQERKNGRS